MYSLLSRSKLRTVGFVYRAQKDFLKFNKSSPVNFNFLGELFVIG